MASIKAKGFESLIADLTMLEISQVGKDMLEAAEKPMVDAVTRHASKHHVTGSMAGSVKSTGVKDKGGDKYLVVRPTGKGPDGVRNMEKMAYLEYGTYKQAATPVITPAVKEAEPKVISNMEKVFDEKIKRLKV